MELKVGDKVRFLNEKGGGIVTALLSTTMVQVAIEEGFEVPVMVNDLVKIEPGGMADRFFDRPIDVPARKKEAPEPGLPTTNKPVTSKTNQTHDNLAQIQQIDPVTPIFKVSVAGITEGIYLVYEPQDQNWLITGNLNLYLINNTSYDAIFSFLLEEDGSNHAGVSYDVISPYSKIHLETITREDIETWSVGIVQVIFHAPEMRYLYRPLFASFSIKPSRFYKETSYKEFPLTASKVILLDLGDHASQKMSSDDSFDKLDIDPSVRQKVEAVAPTSLIDKHKSGHLEAEVDLHISALREDYSSMPQNDILQYQVEYFMKMLESAIAYNYRRVVFIHGIGNGVLKSAIINKLKDYENIELRKARFEKYGNGAVEIIIHQ